MIDREDWIMIKDLRSRGCFIKDIATKLACSDKTVSRALKRQGPPPARKVGVRKSNQEGSAREPAGTPATTARLPETTGVGRDWLPAYDS